MLNKSYKEGMEVGGKYGLTDIWRIKIMRTRELKGVFSIEIFKRIKFLNDEYMKCITGHFWPLFYSCIYIALDVILKP